MLNNTYHIITYGCQMNAHDSERIAGILTSRGYSPSSIEQASLIIVNTCCVRKSAETKIIGNIGALKRYKDADKNLRILICGCMVEQPQVRKNLKERYRFVDGVFSTNDLNSFVSVLDIISSPGNRSFELDYEKDSVIEGEDFIRETYPLSFVNIMYGCNNFCSYCIVPYVRGRERSRESGRIIDEIKRLASDGYKEVTLLGQNVNSYGEEKNDFVHLLSDIADKTGISRIRFMTSHPKDLTDELITAFRDMPQLCPHIHLPVQSGSNRILELMNRRYTREHYLALIQKLRDARHGIAVSTDIIVGFPGESDEEFAETMDLCENVGFDAAFTFMYSQRSGTAAAVMDGQIPLEIKRDRIKRLIALQDGITLEKNRAEVRNTYPVLVESVSTRNENEVCGRTPHFKMVNFAGNAGMIGEITNVKIIKANRTTLSGELADE